MRCVGQNCALALSALLWFVEVAHSTLVLHQVVEGSSFNKAVFVKNVGSTSIQDLQNWAIWLARNGGEWESVVQLSEVDSNGRQGLASGSSFGVCNSRADAGLLQRCAQTSGSMNFNGDDAVGLYNLDGSTWRRVDQVGAANGAAGWQQGSGWEVAGVSGATTVQYIPPANLTSNLGSYNLFADRCDTVYSI